MATSDSDDFESANDEYARAKQFCNTERYPTTIGSDSDCDVDDVPVQYHTPLREFKRSKVSPEEEHIAIDKADDKTDKSQTDAVKKSGNKGTDEKLKSENNSKESSDEMNSEKTSKGTMSNSERTKPYSSKRERPQRQRKPKEVQTFGAKKLEAMEIDDDDDDKMPDLEPITLDEYEGKPDLVQECWEEGDEQNLQEELKKAKENDETKEESSETEGMEDPINMPEELLSNLTFKDIFKPEGWESFGGFVELPKFSYDKFKPALSNLTSDENAEQQSPSIWKDWGSWGANGIFQSATASVITFTNQVSQGLSLIEESIGIPDPENLVKTESLTEEKSKSVDKEKETVEKETVEKETVEKETVEKETVEKEEPKENESQTPLFGFGNLMSSVSQITKYVESTGSTLISGGLGTLETIGKKTMDILQDGDPGLKKKRAFFSNDEKPILSQVLREAKEKAAVEEKSIEEKELARKVHFESLFDDYQGLVHLEALEMLSRQCNIKIEQKLVDLDGNDLTSMQETLDEVKELCDLGDEDDEEEDEKEKNKDLERKLQEGCKDLGVSITYEKIINIWNEMNSEFALPESKDISHREIYQKAISALAQFTACSVERFHKTAELLLIKQRRSTVNEADSLVQLTKTLSSQIVSVANLYCDRLKEFKEEPDKSDISNSIKTISLEATNASSYIQEAFRLLIPILQVGAI